jgi:hypothetical protein
MQKFLAHKTILKNWCDKYFFHWRNLFLKQSSDLKFDEGESDLGKRLELTFGVRNISAKMDCMKKMNGDFCHNLI